MKLTQFIIALSLVYLAACSANHHHKKLRVPSFSDPQELWVIIDAGHYNSRLHLLDINRFVTYQHEIAQVESKDFLLSDVLDSKKSMGQCLIDSKAFGTIPNGKSNTPELKAKYYGECLGEKIKLQTIGKKNDKVIELKGKVQKILIESTVGASKSRGDTTDEEYLAVQKAVKNGIETQCGDLCIKDKVKLTILSGRLQGLYGYISAFLYYKNKDTSKTEINYEILKKNKYRENAIYLEVGGDSIQLALSTQDKIEFSKCLSDPNVAQNSQFKNQIRFSKSFKKEAKKSSKGTIDFQWNHYEPFRKNMDNYFFSKSFLGNANNDIVNHLEQNDQYKFCSKYKPQHHQQEQGPNRVQRDSNGMMIYESTQIDDLGTTYAENLEFDYKQCKQIIKEVTGSMGMQDMYKHNYLKAAECGQINTQIINIKPMNLLQEKSFESLELYEQEIEKSCQGETYPFKHTFPPEFGSNLCLNSMISINFLPKSDDIKRYENVKDQSAELYAGSLFFQKNTNTQVESLPWEQPDTNQKEDDIQTIQKIRRHHRLQRH